MWESRADNSSGRLTVKPHASPGYQIERPAPLSGTEEWSDGGLASRFTFENGVLRVTEVYGSNGFIEKSAVKAVAVRDGYLLGSTLTSTSVVEAGEKRFSVTRYDEYGRLLLTAVIHGSSGSGSSPNLLEAVAGGCTKYSLSSVGNSLVSINRRYYESDAAGDPVPGGNLVAVATWSPNVATPRGASTTYFPLTAHVSWNPKTVSPSARVVPESRFSCDGASVFLDVDVTDFDSGRTAQSFQAATLYSGAVVASNGLLNEGGERQPAWYHQVRSADSGSSVGLEYRSTLTTFDTAGRVLQVLRSEIISTDGLGLPLPMTMLTARSTYGYASTVELDPRTRGRRLSENVYPQANLSSGFVKVEMPCTTASNYDERGHRRCRQSALNTSGSQALQTNETIDEISNGIRKVILDTGGLGGLQHESWRLADGTVFRSGAVGGNFSTTGWTPTTDGSVALWPTHVVAYASNGVGIARTETDYFQGRGGGPKEVRVYSLPDGLVKRRTVYERAPLDAWMPQSVGIERDVALLRQSISIYSDLGLLEETRGTAGTATSRLTYFDSGPALGKVRYLSTGGSPSATARTYAYDAVGRLSDPDIPLIVDHDWISGERWSMRLLSLRT